jgi:hypothetical protein
MGLFAFNAMRRKAEAEMRKKAKSVKAAEVADKAKEEPALAETAVEPTEPVTAAVEKKKRKKAATVENKEA